MPWSNEVTVRVAAPTKPSWSDYVKKYGPLALLALALYYTFRR